MYSSKLKLTNRSLVYTALVMPVRITFFDDSIVAWVVCDWVLDIIFMVDIVINFFSAYFDSEENLIAEKKVI